MRKIIFVSSLMLILLAGSLSASSGMIDHPYEEMKDLNRDLDSYLGAAKKLYSFDDRWYISKLAVHNIYRQKAIWRNNRLQNEMTNDLLSESLVKFIFINYYVGNPNWADWGFWNLETFYPSYTAYIDTTTDMTYGECLSFVKNNWLASYAKCNAFNELVGPKRLEDNKLSLVVRRAVHADEDRYVLRCAEEYLNYRMEQVREWFTFFLPEGEYQIEDEKGWVFPKEFEASDDSAQFVYFTPNYSFDFIPVAQVFTDTGYYFDTLSTTEFELVRVNEGRLAVFDSLEFGRYIFKVKPPYKIVDKFPNKLIIPKDAFGADYMDRESTMFNKHAYDKVTIGNRQKLIYNKIEWVKTPVYGEKEE